MLKLSFIFGNAGFLKYSPGYEKIASLSFIASARDCSFDAICNYLKLKMIFIYGNDVSLETVCPIWKQLVGQLIAFPIVVVVLYLLILLVENIVHIWVVGFPKSTSGCEKIAYLIFIASATDCSFDAICHYLKLKMIFIYGNDVSLETACPLWKQLVGQLIAFPIVVFVPYLLILHVENIHIWVVGFPKCSSGYEKIVSLNFIASATDCSFDAVCHYLKLKMIFMYGKDVSLETACPIWKQLVGQLTVSPMVVVPDLHILQVGFIVFIWERWFSKTFTWL